MKRDFFTIIMNMALKWKANVREKAIAMSMLALSKQASKQHLIIIKLQ
jgi:hypothetical protein